MPIDGLYPSVLATRDLASRMQLQALPTLHADAETTIPAMAAQFDWVGAPLVLKTDNGSPFIAGDFREFLKDRSAILLLSSPRTPRHNDSVQAGMRSLKTGTS